MNVIEEVFPCLEDIRISASGARRTGVRDAEEVLHRERTDGPRGDILKTLYYQDALRAESSVGSLLLWSALREAGHHEDGAPLGRETLEAFVDDLAARGLLEKRTPGGFGRLLTDYEAHLTRKGRGLLEGAVSASPDVLVGDL